LRGRNEGTVELPVGNLEIATRAVHLFLAMARVVKSLLLLLGVAAGFQAAPLLRPASQAAVSRCAADSIQVRAALFSKHGGSLEGSLELDACKCTAVRRRGRRRVGALHLAAHATRSVLLGG